MKTVSFFLLLLMLLFMACSANNMKISIQNVNNLDISYGTSSFAAYVANSDDIEIIVKLFHNKGVEKQDTSTHFERYKAYSIGFRDNSSPIMLITIDENNNMQITNHAEIDTFGDDIYTIDNNDLYNIIDSFYKDYYNKAHNKKELVLDYFFWRRDPRFIE